MIIINNPTAMGSSKSKPCRPKNSHEEQMIKLREMVEFYNRTCEKIQNRKAVLPTMEDYRLDNDLKEAEKTVRSFIVVIHEQQAKKKQEMREDLNEVKCTQIQQELLALGDNQIDQWLASLYSLPDAPKKEQK